MVQIIEQSDRFGKIGKAFGEGLSEQLPKEMDRYYLSQGLKQFEKDAPNLTPTQKMTRLYSIRGITPQMIQTYGELQKNQGNRGYYGGPRGNAPGDKRYDNTTPTSQEPALENNMPKGPGNVIEPPKSTKSGGVGGATKTPAQTQNDEAPKEVVTGNPLAENLMPLIPPTPQERRDGIGQILDQDPYMTPDEASRIFDRNWEQKQKGLEARQARYAKSEGVRAEAVKALDSDLELKLQKKLEGKELFKDLSGEQINHLRRGMMNDLATTDMSIPQATDKWSNIGLEIAKTDNQVQKALTAWEMPESTLKSLDAAGKIYSNYGMQETYKNKLVAEGFSPQYASLIAYPRSNSAKNAIANYKPSKNITGIGAEKNGTKWAKKISEVITTKDSFIAIAQELKRKNPYFDEGAYFDYLRKNQDEIGVTDAQRQEIIRGETKLIPNWKDIYYFPLTHRSVVHD